MKVIVIEGCDNLGKTTLIANLVKHYSTKYNILIKHSGKPETSDNILSAQRHSFIEESNNLYRMANTVELFDKKEMLVIYDRFVQGEYVWGHLYRNFSIEDIKYKCVKPVMDNIIFDLGEQNIMSILLDAPTEFIYNNDDGKSFCSDKDKDEMLYMIQRQRDLFYLSIMKHEFLCFPNRAVYDVYDKNTNNFKNEQTITNDIVNLLNKHLHLDE